MRADEICAGLRADVDENCAQRHRYGRSCGRDGSSAGLMFNSSVIGLIETAACPGLGLGVVPKPCHLAGRAGGRRRRACARFRGMLETFPSRGAAGCAELHHAFGGSALAAVFPVMNSTVPVLSRRGHRQLNAGACGAVPRPRV